MEVLFLSLSITFLALFLASVVAIIIGCIKPQYVIRWGDTKKRTKRNVIKYYGIPMLICFIIVLTSYTSLENIKAVKVAKAEVELAKITADKIAADKVIADKVIADKVIADKVISDKVKADKIKEEKAVADKVIADKIIKDKAIADKARADKIASEKAKAIKIKNDSESTNIPKESTSTAIQTTNTTNDNSNAIRELNSQLQLLEANQAKLAEHSQEYRDGLLEKQKLLQQIINLSK